MSNRKKKKKKKTEPKIKKKSVKQKKQNKKTGCCHHAVCSRCCCHRRRSLLACMMLSLTSGETVRELMLVGAAHARACAGVRVVLALEFGSSCAACCSFHFDSKTGFGVGSGQPKTIQSVILGNFF